MKMLYILDANGDPTPCADVVEWARWMGEDHQRRVLQQDDIEGYFVSTIFLGIDMDIFGGKPILYETMINTPTEGWAAQWRYHTRANALTGHERVKALVRHDLAHARQITRAAILAALAGEPRK